jgi:hypothetical protein
LKFNIMHTFLQSVIYNIYKKCNIKSLFCQCKKDRCSYVFLTKSTDLSPNTLNIHLPFFFL